VEEVPPAVLEVMALVGLGVDHLDLKLVAVLLEQPILVVVLAEFDTTKPLVLVVQVSLS
jgi:hypothetical protein